MIRTTTYNIGTLYVIQYHTVSDRQVWWLAHCQSDQHPFMARDRRIGSMTDSLSQALKFLFSGLMNFGARDGGCILWDCFPSGRLGTAAGEEKPGEYDRIYSTIDFREETGHHQSWYSPASGPPVAAGEQNIEVWNEVSGSMGHLSPGPSAPNFRTLWRC